MQNRVIILADSRGRGVTSRVRYNALLPPETQIQGTYIGGATLQTLIAQLHRRTNNCTDQPVVVIIGGICNYTTKERTHRGAQVCYYRNPQRLQQTKELYEQLIQLADSRGLHLILTTIPAASLLDATLYDLEFSRLAASKFTESELTEQQISLEEDLKQINKYIVQRAQELNLLHIRLNSALERVSYKLQGKSRGTVKGHLRHCYKCLYDGIHPDDTTKIKWADLITKYIVKALSPAPVQSLVAIEKVVDREYQNQRDEEACVYNENWDYIGYHNTEPSSQVTVNPEEITTEESQSEEEGWNHKRRKTTL
jgi:hypothetical protein